MTIAQSCVAYLDGGRCVVRGAIDGECVAEAADHAEALQAGLDRLDAQGGGELTVEAGVYTIGRPLNVPSRVTVRGRGRASVLKLGAGEAGAGSDAAVLLAEGRDGLLIADLACQGPGDEESLAGVVLRACGDSEVRGVFSAGFGACGILVERGSFLVRLSGCTTAGNGGAGILVRDCAGRGRGGDFVPNLLLGCTSYGERGHGFHLDHTICGNLVGCVAYQPAGYGIYVANTANSTCITGCRVFEAASGGVRVENSHEINISSNIFCWNRGPGIELEHVIWGTVSANDVIDSGGVEGPPSHGIALHTDTKSVQVTGNAVFNWEGHLPMRCGIHESDDCAYNTALSQVSCGAGGGGEQLGEGTGHFA